MLPTEGIGHSDLHEVTESEIHMAVADIDLRSPQPIIGPIADDMTAEPADNRRLEAMCIAWVIACAGPDDWRQAFKLLH